MKHKILLFSALLLLLFSACGKEKASRPADHVISHRGASAEAPEHSFRAYDLAISYGAKYIEQDAVLSKDGTLFVSHDTSALRMTGVDADYRELTDREIETLRTAEGEPILKLEQVFDRYGRDVFYVVELKNGKDGAEAFEKLVREKKIEDRVLVQCTDYGVLAGLEEVFPDMPKLLLVGAQNAFEEALHYPYADVLCVDKILMSKKNYNSAHEYGKKFNVWTLNTREEIEKAIAIGVDSYFTNDTALALKLEKTLRKG